MNRKNTLSTPLQQKYGLEGRITKGRYEAVSHTLQLPQRIELFNHFAQMYTKSLQARGARDRGDFISASDFSEKVLDPEAAYLFDKITLFSQYVNFIKGVTDKLPQSLESVYLRLYQLYGSYKIYLEKQLIQHPDHEDIGYQHTLKQNYSRLQYYALIIGGEKIPLMKNLKPRYQGTDMVDFIRKDLMEMMTNYENKWLELGYDLSNLASYAYFGRD